MSRRRRMIIRRACPVVSFRLARFLTQYLSVIVFMLSSNIALVASILYAAAPTVPGSRLQGSQDMYAIRTAEYLLVHSDRPVILVVQFPQFQSLRTYHRLENVLHCHIVLVSKSSGGCRSQMKTGTTFPSPSPLAPSSSQAVPTEIQRRCQALRGVTGDRDRCKERLVGGIGVRVAQRLPQKECL
ncbi:hypothetical protein BV25DRAFT_1473023 [Artomyces pyxidatus]|uniref:Uncharacterized protein n=1 Tax=Artomyces pyxidatus TaxID=48021 RepID=A0ACB8SKT6_9AGAM|nr:hypothetical protein BV25DRAFT_1473023 [Artomyces pyxidatus]